MSAGEKKGPSAPAASGHKLEYQSSGPGDAVNSKCFLCGGDLQWGIVVDQAHLGRPTGLIWAEGAWEKGWWTDFNLPEGSARYLIQASRCERCCRLEFYASTKA